MNYAQEHGACKQISLKLQQGEHVCQVQLMGDILQDDNLVLSSDSLFSITQSASLAVCFLDHSFVVNGDIRSCSKIGSIYLLSFHLQQQDKLQTRMLLQLSEIEQYRHSLLEQGRELTIDEAACEWVGKYAESFAAEFDSDHA